MHWHRGDADTRRKILEHRKIFRALWKNFVIASEQCIALGGGLAFEGRAVVPIGTTAA